MTSSLHTPDESPHPTQSTALHSVRLDAVCADAAPLAREQLVAYAGLEQVGEHREAQADEARTVTHTFEAHTPGYGGWFWAVTVMRAEDSEHVTVAEIALLPGADALLAPAWVPWEERIRPEDLTEGAVMPAPGDDERLVPAYLLSEDPAVEDVAHELGVSRHRVMSRVGRDMTAERWYEGESGPGGAGVPEAPGPCGECGFYLPLAGSLGAVFGVCGNVYAADDGNVVSADHGCGAFSEGTTEGHTTQPTSL